MQFCWEIPAHFLRLVYFPSFLKVAREVMVGMVDAHFASMGAGGDSHVFADRKMLLEAENIIMDSASL